MIEALQRLFQQRGQIRFDLKPVPGSSFHELDFLRIKNYFQDIRRQDTPPDDDIDAWKRLLVNTEIDEYSFTLRLLKRLELNLQKQDSGHTGRAWKREDVGASKQGN